jgi:hypothetical protein
MAATPRMITLLGLGLGLLVVLGARQSKPRETMTLRDRAIEAQRVAALSAARARVLTEQWSATKNPSERKV